MTKMLMVMLAFALALNFLGCGPGTVNVAGDAGGGTVELRPGQALAVTLPSNASTGYRWMLTAPPDEDVLALAGNEYRAPSSRLLGAGGDEVWRFTARAKGTTTFTLAYLRPWEDAHEQEFTLTVVVK